MEYRAQGSVLGPIFFIIYINTLAEIVKESGVYLFADDTKVFKAIYNEENCKDLQKDLDNMFEWTSHSLLKFHPDKCGTM